MPKQFIKNFLGYSSSPEAVFDNPSVGSDCANILIQQGDIVNFPYDVYENIDEVLKMGKNRVMTLVNNFKKNQAIAGVSKFILFVVDNRVNGVPVEDKTFVLGEIINDELNELSNLSYPPYRSETSKLNDYGANFRDIEQINFIQLEEWTFVLYGRFRFIEDTTKPGTFIREPSSMIRIKGSRIEPLGIHAPVDVEVTSSGTGDLNGIYDFAFSIFREKIREPRPPDTITGFQSGYVELDDSVESNALIMSEADSGVESVINADSTIFKIILRDGFIGTRDTHVNIYAREKNTQDLYYFIGSYINPQISWTPSQNGTIVSFTLNWNAITTPNTLKQLQDFGRTAPLGTTIPIVGSHNVPFACFHAAFYKRKMYYSSTNEPLNLLQISMARPLDAVSTGKYAAYIEKFEFIGKDSELITGLIEYQGQLIIFKETETYVLTDDIEIGTVRKLFNVGCVNVKGGKGYIIIENILYFVSQFGIYKFDGSELVNIGEIIKEDLQEIPRHKYSMARLGHDSRYNLLYLTFPSDVEITFVYNYNEGVWTKLTGDTAFQQIIVDQSVNDKIWVNRLDKVSRLGLITDAGSDQISRLWFWKSSIFDATDFNKLKHWRYASVEMPQEFDDSHTVDFEYNNEQNNGSILNEIIAKTKPIGMHSRGLMIKLKNNRVTSAVTPGPPQLPVLIPFINKFTYQPFRITGLSIDAHIKGKR